MFQSILALYIFTITLGEIYIEKCNYTNCETNEKTCGGNCDNDECVSGIDCSVTDKPYCSNGHCIECAQTKHCENNSFKKICFGSNNQCVECTMGHHCSFNPSKTHCNNQDKTCVECTTDHHCGGGTDNNCGSMCLGKRCIIGRNCINEPKNHFCKNNDECVECVFDYQCKGNPVGEYCGFNGNCVKCYRDWHCRSDKYCNATCLFDTNTCSNQLDNPLDCSQFPERKRCDTHNSNCVKEM
jgi:hypothetical protein